MKTDDCMDFDGEHAAEWDLLENIEEPEPDYDNSGPLDIHLYSEDTRVEKAARDLCSEIGYKLDRAITHMKVVLLNLYWANHLSPHRWVGYTRNNNRYGMDFRYNRQRVEVHPLIKVVDGLIGRDYIKQVGGKFTGIPDKGRCTRMQATGILIDLLLGKYGFTIDVVGRHPDEEVIFLKDIKKNNKKLIWYEDTSDTSKMRKFLNQYNEFLQQTYIDIDYMGYVHKKQVKIKSPDHLSQLPKCLHFDLTKRKMRRIFNNRSFMQGGRFYGGFWMEMPSKMRLRLIIEMQKVVEADYSGIHIHLLYNQVGIDYGLTKQDPYDIPDYPSTPEYRNLFKKLLLATINAQDDEKSTGKQKAMKALQKDINFNRADYPAEIPKLSDLIDNFKNYHQPIAGYLCTGEGLKLMYQDSQIAEQVMKSMMDHKIPVLPVHDSFICPKQYSDVLTENMIEAYKNVTGKNISNTKYAVNIKEPDEWNRAIGNELFPDDNYYFNIGYTEDTDLIKHMVGREEDVYYDELDEEYVRQGNNVKPHVLYVNVPIGYDISYLR